MAQPVKWNVDNGHTTVEVQHTDEGTEIWLQQGDDIIVLSATGASPTSMADGIYAAILSVQDIAEFDLPECSIRTSQDSETRYTSDGGPDCPPPKK